MSHRGIFNKTHHLSFSLSHVPGPRPCALMVGVSYPCQRERKEKSDSYVVLGSGKEREVSARHGFRLALEFLVGTAHVQSRRLQGPYFREEFPRNARRQVSHSVAQDAIQHGMSSASVRMWEEIVAGSYVGVGGGCMVNRRCPDVRTRSTQCESEAAAAAAAAAAKIWRRNRAWVSRVYRNAQDWGRAHAGSPAHHRTRRPYPSMHHGLEPWLHRLVSQWWC